MLAGVIGLFRWDRRRALLYLWFLPLLLFLAYGSMSLTSYRPVYKEVRYLTPLCAPLALLTASLAVEWLSSRRSRKADGGLQRGGRPLRGWLLALFLVGLAGFSWWVAGRIRERHDRNSASFESAARLLGRDRSVPIYFDHWRTALAMSYYFRFKEGAEVYRDAEDSLRIGPPGTFRGSRFGYLAWYQDPDSVPPGYIVIDRELLALAARAGSPPARYLGVVVPGFCFAPPGTWEPASGFGRITVYRNRGPGTRGGAAPAEFPVTGMGPGGSPEPRGGP
jgi:hypothetical protein